MLALISLAGVLQIVELLRSVGSPLGPGTSVASRRLPSGLEEVIGRACWRWSEVPEWLGTMFTTNMSTLVAGGADWLWLLLGGAAVAAGARLAALFLAATPTRRRALQLPAYLLLVGLIAAVVPAVSRCGLVYDRYVLLALLAPAGVAALYLKAERRAALRAAFVGVVLLVGTFNAAGLLRYAADHYASPPDPRIGLADYLVSSGTRFARSDYWTAYHLTFLSGERVIVASTDVARIRHYQSVVAEHAAEAVTISRARCEGGSRVHGYYVCPPSR